MCPSRDNLSKINKGKLFLHVNHIKARFVPPVSILHNLVSQLCFQTFETCLNVIELPKTP